MVVFRGFICSLFEWILGLDLQIKPSYFEQYGNIVDFIIPKDPTRLNIL